MVVCQLTYTTNRQINISTCPHRVVILSIAPLLFRTAKLSESNASAPTNKPPKKRLGELKCHLKKRGYNNASINHCFNKAIGIDGKDLIQYKEKTRTTECHLSSHTILRSVIYPTSFVSTGQPYKNTQNCVKSSKNHPSWPSGNQKVWKTSWWELKLCIQMVCEHTTVSNLGHPTVVLWSLLRIQFQGNVLICKAVIIIKQISSSDLHSTKHK